MTKISEKNDRPYPEHLKIKKELRRGDIKMISDKLINPQNGKNYNESYIGLVLNGYRFNKLIIDYAMKIVEANKLANNKLSEFECDNEYIESNKK